MSKLMKMLEAARASENAPVRNDGSYFPALSDKIGWLGFLAAVLPLLAIISPINHDETQYIAAAQLASEDLVPFRDFLYLQTPYQIYFFAPLFSIFGESGFVAARVATGMLGAGILAGTFFALRAARVEPAQAAICSILLWLCHTFVFSVTVVRNDALPAFLLTIAIWIAASQLSDKSEGERRAVPWFVAGALLGLAAGTKIPYLAPAFAFAGCLGISGARAEQGL